MLYSVQNKLVGFRNDKLLMKFILSLMKRNGLSYRIVRQVEETTINELSKTYVVEHLSGLRAAMDGYNIKESRYVFNMDLSDACFEKMIERSLRKEFFVTGKNLSQ